MKLLQLKFLKHDFGVGILINEKMNRTKIFLEKAYDDIIAI